MKIYIILIFLAATIVGCSHKKENLGENGFKFFDAHTQALIVEALKKEGIQFRLREDGTILYSPQDDARVQKIEMEVLHSSFVPSIHYEDESYERRFIEKLNSDHIAFGIENRDGKRWITWSKQDDEHVHKLLETP